MSCYEKLLEINSMTSIKKKKKIVFVSMAGQEM